MHTSKSRVMAAVNHTVADRTPITFDAQPELYVALHERYGTGGNKQALFDHLKVDTWFIGGKRPPEAGGSLWGYQTREVDYGAGKYPELCYSPLAGKDELTDIDAHPWPDGSALTFDHVPQEAAAEAKRAIIGHSTWGAFFLATYIRGMENLMLDFGLRPAYAEKLIGTIAERCLLLLDQLLANSQGVDLVYIADDYCSQQGPLFSPADFKRLVVPYLRQTADRVHAAGKKLLLHCCGAVRPLLPMIIEAGVDVLEPLQIRAEGMEPMALKRDFGRDICFYGGIDLQQVMPGPRQGVIDEVRRMIDIMGADSGYIIGPGHTYLQVDTPLENIDAMYQTAANYCPHST